MIALMRRMSMSDGATIESLSGPPETKPGESRIRRELILLRDRCGVAERRAGLWRLRFRPEWLDPAQLPRGGRILDETPSALDIARESGPGDSIFAEMQTRGRGRRGRVWRSVPAGAILLAVRLPSPRSPLGLPLAVGVGVLRALEADGAARLKLKWPNDILDRQGRKVGGILAEASGGSLVVGAGINLLMTPELRAALGRPAAGLVADLRAPQRRNIRAGLAAEAVAESVAEFGRSGVKNFLPDALSRHIAAPGESVFFRAGDGRKRRGEFAGFGERGELLLRDENGGGLEAHISGEFAADETGDAAGG